MEWRGEERRERERKRERGREERDGRGADGHANPTLYQAQARALELKEARHEAKAETAMRHDRLVEERLRRQVSSK